MIFTTTALGLAVGALIFAIHQLRMANQALETARARVEDVEDRMLRLAGRPDAAVKLEPVSGTISYIDEAREVEMDAQRA